MPTSNNSQNKRFLVFLEALKDSINGPLVEAIATGFTVLYETPDLVEVPSQNLYLEFNDEDAIPFFYLNKQGAFYMDTNLKGQMHLKLINKLTAAEKASNSDKWKDTPEWKISREMGFLSEDGKRVLGTNGRVWLGAKVLSFWEYPSTSDFKTILGKLKEAGVPIDSSWRVEVFMGESSPATLVTVDKYTGRYVLNQDKQEELNRLREMHTMSPIDKEKIKKAKLASGTPTETPTIKTPGDLDGRSMAEYNYAKGSGD